MTEAASALLARLGGAGRRTTRARSRVVSAALRMRAPFTAEEIVKRVAGARVGRATVFRTLDLLVEIGALARIHGIEDGGRCVRYAVCAPAHHHHLVCRSCGRLDEVDLSSIDSKLSRLARARGYSAVAHTVEIAGICGSCQAGRA